MTFVLHKNSSKQLTKSIQTLKAQYTLKQINTLFGSDQRIHQKLKIKQMEIILNQNKQLTNKKKRKKLYVQVYKNIQSWDVQDFRIPLNMQLEAQSIMRDITKIKFSNLRTLQLIDCQITSLQFLSFIDSELRYIKIFNCPIISIASLAKSHHFILSLQLQNLQINHSQLNHLARMYIRKQFWFSTLRIRQGQSCSFVSTGAYQLFYTNKAKKLSYNHQLFKFPRQTIHQLELPQIWRNQYQANKKEQQKLQRRFRNKQMKRIMAQQDYYQQQRRKKYR